MSDCYRCGEKMRKVDKETRIFEIGYKPIGNDAPEWREVELCMDCQRDLRLEFYRRGMLYNG